MTEQEAFQVGFAARCADEGLPPEAVQARLQQACAMMKQAFGLGSFLPSPMTVGMAAIVPPLVAGSVGGYALAKAREEPVDDEDVKNQELSREYRRLASMAREQLRLKKIRQGTL